MRRITKTGWLLALAVALLLPRTTPGADESRAALRPTKVRTGPAVFHAIVERLEAGAKLKVLKDGQRWIQIQTEAGLKGWVSARVFAERPKPQGFSKVLQQQGLTGVSSAVSTMATKGLTVLPGQAGSGLHPLVAAFLDSVPFEPDQFEVFVRALSTNPVCERLPGWLGDLDQPLPGDPERDEQERELGMRLAGLVLTDAELITDSDLDAYVNQVGAAVAAASSRYDLQWRFVVFAQQRPEAFAAPGGLVFLSDGLLAKLSDEAELAGVLAHQVAHVALGHGAQELLAWLAGTGQAGDAEQRSQRLVEQAHRVIRSGRAGRQEREADAYGATYAACAGYDPAGLARVYQRLAAFEPAGPDAPGLAERIAWIEKVRLAAGPTPGQSLPKRYRQAALDR